MSGEAMKENSKAKISSINSNPWQTFSGITNIFADHTTVPSYSKVTNG
jgi:hypothetical protein